MSDSTFPSKSNTSTNSSFNSPYPITNTSSSAFNNPSYYSVPAQPLNLSATGGESSATLTWIAPSITGNSPITDYFIEYKLDSSPTWLTFSHAPNTSTTQTVTGLTDNLLYDFRVSAVNAYGTGSPSSVATGTPISKFPIFTVTTDNSTTPTTTLFTIASGNNAFLLNTGYINTTQTINPKFNIYIRINGGTAIVVEAYRLTRQIFTCNAGDTIAIGTVGAMTFTAVQYTHSLTLPNPSGVTGTANSDKVYPGNWAPTAPHVILTAYNSAFKISATGTRTPLFIREFDGINWTLVSFYILEATRDLTISTVHKKIAIGTYDGSGVGIVAPTGSTIGGTSTDTRIVFPAITGTTYTVSAGSESDLRAKCALAKAGDAIVLPAGTYNMTSAINQTIFTANIAAGHQATDGITIMGATGIASDVVIVPTQLGFSFSYTVNASGLIGTYFKDFTIDATNNTEGIQGLGGKTYMKNVVSKNPVIGGGGATDLITFQLASNGSSVMLMAVDCIAHDADGDCWNFAGGGDGAAINNQCSIVLSNCQGIRCGGYANSQCLTTHFGLGVIVSGGFWSDSFQDVFASESNSTATAISFLEFLTVTPGARVSGVNQSSAFGCNLQVRVAKNQSGLQAATTGGGYEWCFNDITLVSTQNSVVRNQVFFDHNIFRTSSATTNQAGIFYNQNTSTTFYGNICTGFTSGTTAAGILHNAFTSGTGTTVSYYGFTLVGNNDGIRGGESAAVIQYGNTASATNTSGITNIPNSVTNYVSEGYNIFNPTGANYVAGTSDITNADASLDSNYIPTASGNADTGQGNDTVYGFIGSRDIYGLIWIYDTSYVSRGARTRPAIYSGARMVPDAY